MARNAVDWDDDEDDLGGDDYRGNDVPDLRKAYNALKRQYKELQTQYSETQKAVRERSVKDVLASKGMNPKIAAFIPNDLTSDQEIESWVEQYGDVFGAAAPTETAQEEAPVQSPDLQALGRIQSQQQAGAPFTGDAGQVASLISSAQSPEELSKILFGNTMGPVAS